MAITIMAYQIADDFQDARNLIQRIEDQLAPAHRGKLKLARDLLTETEDAVIGAEEEATAS
jgi:hypothetical protein